MNKLRILYLTGIPAPYRVDLFNCIGKTHQLTVAFLAEFQSERNSKWQSVRPESFNAVFLNKGALNGKKIDFSMVNYLKKNANDYDIIVVHGISFVASILAIRWMNNHNIKYGLEADGAIIPNNERKLKASIKKYCIKNADFYLSSGKKTTEYFVHYGADESKCHIYPFTSLSLADIYGVIKLSSLEKKELKCSLNIEYSKTIVSYIYTLSDNDVKSLKRVVGSVGISVGIYLICEENPNESLLNQFDEYSNVHFLYGLDEHARDLYYASADLFFYFATIPYNRITIMESIVFSLPIVSMGVIDSDSNLVEDSINGFVVENNDVDVFVKRILMLLDDGVKLESFGMNSIGKVFSSISDRDSNKELKDKMGNKVKLIIDLKKKNARKQLGILNDTKMVLFIGQFIYRKGIDILLQAASSVQFSTTEFILVGGKPTTDYLNLVEALKLSNVRFIEFVEKKYLSQYFYAADLFVLPTREDIWGLVVNESLSYYVPTITTENCVAGCELLSPEFIIPINNEEILTYKTDKYLNMNFDGLWYMDCISKSVYYSVENSALVHIEIFEGLCK